MKTEPLADELIVLCSCGKRMYELVEHQDEVLYGCVTCIPGQVNVSRKSRGLIETERRHSRACRDQDVARAVEVALANREEKDVAVRSAVQTVLRGFEEGVFVRSIEHDAESGWAIKLLPFIRALAVLQQHADQLTGTVSEPK